MSAPDEAFWTTLPLAPGVKLLQRDVHGLAAFEKPAGILSHPNEKSDEPRSLLTRRYAQDEQAFAWEDAAGRTQKLWLLNRLDGATSGVILVAANAALATAIKEQFAKKRVRKVYLALVFGKPVEKVARWHDMLAVQKQGGQVRTRAAGNIPAATQFQFLKHQQGAFSTSLVRLEPHTGRSHQLRVQCAKRRLPIVGDQTYGDFSLNRSFTKATGFKRLFLHSQETSFSYEFGGKVCAFKASAPLPPEFNAKY